MDVWNFVTSGEVLQLLNLPLPAEESDITFLQARDGVRVMPPAEMGAYLQAACAMRLRGKVDEWLRTGIGADGSERPGERRLDRAPDAWYAIIRYLDQFPARISAFDPGGFRIITGDAGDLPAPSRNPLFDADLDATRLFTGMMLSEWKWWVARCAHCGRYFLLERPRTVYRKGTFCSRRHQSHATALRGTGMRRSRVKSKLIEVAARRLQTFKVAGPKWKDDAPTKKRLAMKLTEYVSGSGDLELKAYCPVVRVKWVTRNRKQIEEKRVELTKK